MEFRHNTRAVEGIRQVGPGLGVAAAALRRLTPEHAPQNPPSTTRRSECQYDPRGRATRDRANLVETNSQGSAVEGGTRVGQAELLTQRSPRFEQAADERGNDRREGRLTALSLSSARSVALAMAKGKLPPARR